ncbi:MAG: MopE-related protein, partial [Phycisphaerales bacterium]
HMNFLRATVDGRAAALSLAAAVVAAGGAHAQSVVMWGANDRGQLNVPAGVTLVTDLEAGEDHTLALLPDGTVRAWGWNGLDQSNVPPSAVNVRSVAAGDRHSIASTASGTVICWGDNFFGQCDIPEGLAGVTQVAAGRQISGALLFDGTVRMWGWDHLGVQDIPPAAIGVIRLELGWDHAMVQRNDGSLLGWGDNQDGQASIPPGLGIVSDYSLGGAHSLVVKSDGTVYAWGENSFGQSTVPVDLTDPATANVVDVCAGVFHSLALQSDGTVRRWGIASAQPMPTGISSTFILAAGDAHDGVALRPAGVLAPTITLVDSSGTSCGAPNGSIDVTVTDSTRFYWTGPGGYFSNKIDLTGLAAGTYTATAIGSGGTATLGVTITQGTDTTAPVITSYTESISEPVDAACGAVIPDFTSSVTASDDCTPAVLLIIEQSPPAGTPVGLGSHVVTISVTDGSDNHSSVTATFEATGTLYTFYRDADLDTFGDPAVSVSNCDGTIPAGYVANSLDCNDAQKFFADADGDGFGTNTCVPCGSVTNNADCDDTNASIFPGAQEVCDANNVDEDCDGLADNADNSAADAGRTDFYIDTDGDGYGAGTAQRFCDLPPGYSALGTDCDNDDGAINPGAEEICDALDTDEDCDGLADNADSSAADAGKTNFYADLDADSYTVGTATRFCDQTEGYLAAPTNPIDCNDNSSAVYPGAEENCANDGVDNDCDGEANSDLEAVDATPYYIDADADQFGKSDGVAVNSCTPMSGRVTNNGDCDDADPATYPGAAELCANLGTDNDCDGVNTE